MPGDNMAAAAATVARRSSQLPEYSSARHHTNIIKIDIDLVRAINDGRPKQAIVKGIIHICHQLDIKVLAESIETKAERNVLLASGVTLMQGYLFCKPAFKATGKIDPDVWI
jgi:EAL domain-containing protein (putative c-di-GMP-specific phosphodiesterase class I)